MFFGCTALAIPHTSGNDPTRPSLTTIVKRQVATVSSSSTDFFPLLYNLCSPPSSTPTSSSDLNSTLRRRVEAKLSDGDVTGAVRLASSNDTLAPFDDETLTGLQSKHPSAPSDLELPDPPEDTSEVLSVSCEVVARAIHSFKAGSAGGLDRLRPQHFKELISKTTGEAGVRLLKSLTTLVNCMLSGKFPDVFQPFFFGANLVALRKPGGGLRPIAVGSVFRRLVAKSACLCLGCELGQFFRLVQLGFGTSGGIWNIRWL